MQLNTHIQADRKSKAVKCYWKVKHAGNIILKHSMNTIQNIILSPVVFAGGQIWNLGGHYSSWNFPFILSGVAKGWVPFWPQNEVVTLTMVFFLGRTCRCTFLTIKRKTKLSL